MIDYRRGVYLRPLDPDNLEIYREERNQPDVRRWCRQTGLIDGNDQKAWYERQRLDTTISMFEIAKKNGDFLGVCGLTSIDSVNRRAEFSLWIKRSEQRQGYARMGLATLLDFAFGGLNLHQVWGETLESNPAYQMFMKMGFRYEGTRRDFYYKDGRFWGAQLVSIKRAEWEVL